MMSFFLRFFLSISISFCYLFSGVAFSQQSVKVTNEEDSYGDWTVRCSQREGSEKRCVMQQQSFITSTKQRLMHVSVNKVGDEKQDVITFALPLLTYLPAGMQLYFDEIREKSVPIIYCDQSACYVKMALDKSLANKISESKKIFVVVTSVQDRSKPVQIPFSNEGFKQALSKLK